MLLIHLKSKTTTSVQKVFSSVINKSKDGFVIDLMSMTDIDKLEKHGYEPNFETLILSQAEFFKYVSRIENVG